MTRKIAKCLEKLPKSDFTRKINDFDTFTKIAYECKSVRSNEDSVLDHTNRSWVRILIQILAERE